MRREVKTANRCNERPWDGSERVQVTVVHHLEREGSDQDIEYEDSSREVAINEGD